MYLRYAYTHTYTHTDVDVEIEIDIYVGEMPVHIHWPFLRKFFFNSSIFNYNVVPISAVQ